MKLLLLLLLMERAAAQQRGLFPAILNLASNAVISSNATCGDPEPEVYCKLVEHVPGRRIKNPHCPKCDANSILSKERHPITNAIDGTNQWWQSPSIKNGRQFHWITVTLDLKQIFQVAYIIIKAANSPRPGNWILERSLDGVTFDPWQFYAISDSECLTRYNVTPRLGPPTYKRDTEVICTSYYSRLNPLEHGEIHTSLINGRPGADDLTSDLLNFTSARYIRLRLQRIRTLNADLMTLSARDPRDIDPIVTRRYYYSIKDISVGGMCICYGHAQSCPLDPVTKKLQCVCEHNTCGESCNKCCPGYHQQPWQPGTVSEGNTCEKCNCHNKAVDCFYNQTVSELSLSLNTHGVRQGGGVCMNCQQNTAGINCETCTAGNYRPAEVSPYSDSPCVQCNCDLRGSESSTCTRDSTQLGVSAGQCRCKEGFTGRQCDRCAFGFRDFPLCTQCECNLSGSINTDPCSPCTCKVNVMGAHCDLCKPGFYNLQDNHPLGCTDCFCFGVSDVCESSAWSTTQVLHKDAWLRPPQSLHTPSVINDNDLPIPGNASSGHAHQQVLSWEAPDSFLGNKLVSYRGFLNYSVVYDLPLDNEDHSLPGHFDIIIEGNGRTLHLSPPLLLFLSPLAERSVAVMIASQRFVDVQTGVHVIRDDLLSVLADVTSLRVRVHLNASADGPIRLRSVSLDVADSGSVSGVQAVAVEMCECPWGYSGTSCEACLPGFYRVGGVLFGGNCMQCECNDHTIECDINGVCLGCTHNTTGPHCEHCLPGFYGDATEGTPDDCRLCPCPLTEPSNSFSPTCVSEGAFGDFRCTACQMGYEGRYCERCSVGYYGNPSVPGGMCSQCSCSGWGSLQPLCDALSGQCECKAGVKGRSCDQCEERHILQEGECVSCDDECTGVLLDDLEKIYNHFLSVNLSGVAMAPYHQLVLLQNQTTDAQVQFSQNGSVALRLSRVEDKLDHLTSDLSTLLQRVTRLSENLEEVGVSAKNSCSQGSVLLENISRLQDRIQELQREAGHLNQTTEEEFSSANQTRLLGEVESMLETIRVVNLTAANTAANQELRLAQSLIHSLQTDFLPGRMAVDERLRPLSVSLNIGIEMLQHAHTQLSDAAQQTTQTHTLLDAIHSHLHRYQSVRQKLSGDCLFVDGLMDDSQLLLDDAVGLTDEFTNATAQVEEFSGQLDQWRPLLRKQVDALVVGLKMTDALENVYRAESHAHLLQSHAHSLHRSLSSVCNVTQNGSRLVQFDSDITERVDSAQQVASIAHSSASFALNMTVQSEQLLSEEGRAKLNISSAVLEESQRVHKMAEDLQLTVSMVTSRLGLVRESVHNSSLLFRQPIRELQNFSNGSSPALQQAQLQAAAARSGLQEALQWLHSLSEQLQDSSSVVENTNDTVRETNQLVTHTHDAANEAQSKLEEAEHRTDRLMDRIKPLSMLGETLSRNLSDIRELIDQARRQAASIKVAVQADRDCVRSYRPQIESSNFNTLSLILKTSSPDNLLFYLSSNTTVDFLAVEMHDGKVSLAWDVGSGSTRLDFPGLDIANNRWTRINATRFGAHGSLSVHQLESESAPLPAVTATSRGPSRVLDIDRNTVIHIGGLGAHTQSPTTLRSSTFQGCLGEASLNERNIGLWNYNSREGECGGCFSSPQAEETSFHFDGSGFSLVQKSLRATSTSIVLLFKTLSPGGLLLYLASNNTRDFLSMELVEGRVRLTFDLGSGALILTSNRKYNTGVWYKITLQRSKRKGYLSIMAADQSTEKEVLEAESPGTASDLNRSDLDPIYIGGLPASRPIRRQVVSRSYVGCIKNVEIARSNFDLLRDAFGVRKGCVLEAVRSVSVLAGGFVQIAPRSLGQEVELFLSFSTNNQSGVVLAAFSDDPTHRQHFLSVHLLSGDLEAELGEVGGATRRVMVVKPVGGSFSDGIKHSVIITINRKSLSMQVDEDHRKSVSLSPGGFSRLSPASFFIAGLPSEGGPHLPIRLQDVSRLFRGCIQHLVVGRVIVDLSEAVRYEGVELDSCLLEERDGGAVLPDDQDVEPTKDPAYLPVPPPTHLSALTPGALTCVPEAEPTFLLSAAHFSLSKHSHMTFIINPSTVRRSVLVRLSVRSRALDGLILLLSDSKQMDFIVLRLTGGRLMMSADLGKGPASITSSVTVNDGKWHIVSAEMSRRLLSVSVDGSSPDSVSVKGNQLDVDNRLYLGGVPHTHTARRINVSSSFPGCIRGVSLNAAMLDLSKPVSLHDVTSCFTTEQTGSYFNGSGYAALMPEGYKVGSDVLVSLEFRTSQSEGVFLGISSAKVDAIGLEMINGQVVFNVNNGAGRVSVHSIGQMLCDGQWHRLLARKTKHTLSLSVDGRSYSTPNPYPQSTSAETNNPVYLGGYPVSVKQNCLSINSRFRGCLRNLQLVKSHLTDALNLSSAHFLLGVTPNSCPVA
ncbi:laminin subunit alpha-1 isoform X3 [Dicentrarchus labrax]|uniref:laminin subunit alpha-1 isoform X3 n=1 Tax=Dicentrarchus labrax TaxID=13489 RepID=UPI0021F67504|nr:laminin subunit alpha-1 isoform X3 [Dicentrarchus labrax]